MILPGGIWGSWQSIVVKRKTDFNMCMKAVSALFPDCLTPC